MQTAPQQQSTCQHAQGPRHNPKYRKILNDAKTNDNDQANGQSSSTQQKQE